MKSEIGGANRIEKAEAVLRQELSDLGLTPLKQDKLLCLLAADAIATSIQITTDQKATETQSSSDQAASPIPNSNLH